jgi:hypothetical protein
MQEEEKSFWGFEFREIGRLVRGSLYGAVRLSLLAYEKKARRVEPPGLALALPHEIKAADNPRPETFLGRGQTGRGYATGTDFAPTFAGACSARRPMR